jgi:hypothetical protein
MPIEDKPQDATKIAFFDEDGAPNVASIKYSVPLPGAYTFGRIVPCRVDDDWFKPEARSTGSSLVDLGVAKVAANDNKILSLDSEKLKLLFRNIVSPAARPSMRLASEASVRLAITDPKSPTPDGSANQAMGGESLNIQNLRRDKFLDAMADSSSAAATTSKAFTMPVRGFGHSIYPIPVEVAATAPRLALVETHQISASLGNYGLGRTLQTISLLPGERRTITLETWRTLESVREDASSIFDSSDTAAQTRFTSAVVSETGTASQDQGGWALSLGLQAKASAPIEMVAGEASFTAGFAANHQEARQQFANNVAQSALEHASQVNAARQHSVDAKTASKEAIGSSEATVREIVNSNLRRVLNFVFRELNQTYTVNTSLRNVRIAFYNGNVDSAEIVSLAELSYLLQKYVVDARQREVALAILALVTECIDVDGTPQTMLQKGTRQGGTFEWADAKLDVDGKLDFPDGEDPLDHKYSWRIARGPIGQAHIPGVVTSKTEVVLRTDNMITEALLGRADALDPYATALQSMDLASRQADVDLRNSEVERMKSGLKMAEDLNANSRVEAWEKLFGKKADVQLIPMAPVNGQGVKPSNSRTAKPATPAGP